MVKRGKAEKSTARGERLAAALRENLKRRKAQARERAVARSHAPGEPARDAAKVETRSPEFQRNRGEN
jgi:hypothetical protein